MATLLRSWRERAHLTQEELAERAGLNVRTIRRWESNGDLRRPQATSLRMLAAALELTSADRASLFAAAGKVTDPVAPDGSADGQHPLTSGDVPPAGVVVPRQLPADVDGFVARTAELTALNRLIGAYEESGTRPMIVAAITGTAGVGKTALALHWAHRVSHRFPDGQLYVDLRGYHPSDDAMEPADAVRGFLGALGVPPTRVPPTPDAQAALYRSIVAGKRLLVVLDNARDSRHVRPLLPGSATCLVATTSRDQLTSLIATNAARPLGLGLLRTDEARDLLARRLDARQIAAESSAADEIVVSCARLPLALAIAAARSASSPHLPLGTLAAQLRQERSGLDALAVGDPYADTRAVFSWSYHGLGSEAARLFRLLGRHHGSDIAVAAAASVAGLPVQRTRTLLAELCRAHLLIEHRPGRYTSHDLLRAYAAELAHDHDGSTDIRSASHRAVDHDLHTAHAAARLLNPDREPICLARPQPGVVVGDLADHAQAMTWFTDEHTTVLAAVDRASSIGLDTHAWQLAWSLADFLNWRGHWRVWRAICQTALDAARRLGDRAGQAHTHRNLAGAYLYTNQLEDSCTQLREALDLYEQLGDRIGQARTHYDLGRLFGSQNRHIEARQHTERALDLYVASDDRNGEARALNATGRDEAQLGDFHNALIHCQQALTLNQEIGSRLGEATAWDSVGHVHHRLGDHDRAYTCYQRALDLARDLGNRILEAGTLDNIGDMHLAAGDADAARLSWREALSILDDLGHPHAGVVRTKLTRPAATDDATGARGPLE
ncbi:tetratricopeptide repeat protein [Pseudonocardia kunmingensis]|uniref:NB-ARC domain-containing protein n=1 Tax=Pseudonocardia kunmingensis TaxID=630975 RepID=A0A543DAU5_9PSEU|nr:tetratricopeptide repeat protein [Pseudonocardia kunmingensis]TQM06452.1 NB-ARC domain-containing protein [Pseudonocardia kunmingensis]